jgi:Ca-activated chloride channel family protein
MSLIWVNPLCLLLLPLALIPLWRQSRAALPVSHLALHRRSGSNWRLRLARLHMPTACLGLLILILLLAEPTLRSSSVKTIRQGVDLILVLDISASMKAADLEPDRISVAREAASRFVEKRLDDRIGVILFAGTPFLLSPPTSDRQQVARRLRTVTAEQRGTGTAVGDALAAAVDRLADSRANSRAIVLLTDGRSNRGQLEPLAAGKAAAALGIRVYTIGFGTETGAAFHFDARGPLPAGHPTNTIRATLDEPLLQQVAGQTGGRYFRATDGAALEWVYQQIDALEKSPLEEQITHHDRPVADILAPWLAALLILELLLFRCWFRRLP